MAWKKTGVATFLTALAATGAQAQQGTGPAWGHGYWSGPWHGWFMGPLMMLVYLAIIAGVVILVVRWLGLSRSALRPGNLSGGPIEILKERFARGEIDKEEFDERRKVLEE
jgi:putative membrane protein